MQILSIQELKKNTSESSLTAAVHVQLSQYTERTTSSGKPFLVVTFTDATEQLELRIWDTLPQFQAISQLDKHCFLSLEGDWIQNKYGVDGVHWSMRKLEQSEIDTLLTGDEKTRRKQERDWQYILDQTASISDPRLHSLCKIFISEHGSRFRRTAGARRIHHARRGGLVEHVAQMMRSAVALTTVYEHMNLDLLLSAILFHDCGKMWENSYDEQSFAQNYELMGEMLGHIPIGIQITVKLWDTMTNAPEAEAFKTMTPKSDLVKMHLLHLIASHHGSYEFGSPTLPRTPEAMLLHHIDNIDAKLETMHDTYNTAPELAPNILQKQFPLPANLVQPLEHFKG